MSERSVYLRNQAAKCEWYAENTGVGETQSDPRKLAGKYVEEAAEIETIEKHAGPPPPSLWLNGPRDICSV